MADKVYNDTIHDAPLLYHDNGDGTYSPVVWQGGGTALPTGAATSANQATELTDLGAVTETAPATDTASSGLNGRLQRVAQRLTSMIALLPTALGAGGGLKIDGSGTLLPVSPPTAGFTSSATFTATAVAYTANNTMGAAAQFTTIGASGKNIIITGAELEIDTTAIQAGETTYRLYLYNVTPPSALANNTAWDLPSGDRASFLGYVDLPTPVDLGSTCYGQAVNVNKEVLLSTTGVFAYLVTNGSFTATAIARKVTLHAQSLI